MARRLARTRMLDAVIVTVALACLSAPFLPSSTAAEAPVLETGVTVDQQVRQSGLISFPLNGEFDVAKSGRSSGKIDWDVYSSAGDGFKLTVSSDGTPAMRDEAQNASVSDYGSGLSAWSVGAGERRFGFSVVGEHALGAYDGGAKWRGFSGRKGIEAARRTQGATSSTRTTVKLSSEMRSALPGGAKPKAWIVATVMLNL